MRKLVILFDADDVLVDSTTPGIERYNEEYGEKLKYEDVVNYLDDAYFPVDQSIEKYYDEPGFYRGFKPFSGAQNLVKRLKEEGHELYIATASDISAIFDKMGCYDEHFPEFHSKTRNVIPIYNKSLLKGSVIIDDMPYNLENSSCPVKLLMDRPWNRKAVGKFVRCFSYEDVYRNINEYAEEVVKPHSKNLERSC